jgi:hypothetical protein
MYIYIIAVNNGQIVGHHEGLSSKRSEDYLQIVRIVNFLEPIVYIQTIEVKMVFPLSKACMTISQPNALSSSETRGNPWIRS